MCITVVSVVRSFVSYLVSEFVARYLRERNKRSNRQILNSTVPRVYLIWRDHCLAYHANTQRPKWHGLLFKLIQFRINITQLQSVYWRCQCEVWHSGKALYNNLTYWRKVLDYNQQLTSFYRSMRGPWISEDSLQILKIPTFALRLLMAESPQEIFLQGLRVPWLWNVFIESSQIQDFVQLLALLRYCLTFTLSISLLLCPLWQ